MFALPPFFFLRKGGWSPNVTSILSYFGIGWPNRVFLRVLRNLAEDPTRVGFWDNFSTKLSCAAGKQISAWLVFMGSCPAINGRLLYFSAFHIPLNCHTFLGGSKIANFMEPQQPEVFAAQSGRCSLVWGVPGNLFPPECGLLAFDSSFFLRKIWHSTSITCPAGASLEALEGHLGSIYVQAWSRE